MTRRNWKDKTVEDLIDYYQTNYAGKSRGEVEKADSGFYDAVRIRKLQEQVFPESKIKNNRSWKNKTVEDFQNYYQTNHLGKSRSEVDKADNGFYQAVCKRRLQDQVLPKSTQLHHRVWKDKTVEELIDHYNEHYSGLSRSEVQKIDGSFYTTVCKRKLLDQVFPESKLRNWSEFEAEDLIDYYNEHHVGRSRHEVEKADSGFYSQVYRRELQNQVFPESKLRDWNEFELEDFQKILQRSLCRNEHF